MESLPIIKDTRLFGQPMPENMSNYNCSLACCNEIADSNIKNSAFCKKLQYNNSNEHYILNKKIYNLSFYEKQLENKNKNKNNSINNKFNNYNDYLEYTKSQMLLENGYKTPMF